MSGVFVWVDQFHSKALPISWEALGVGRKLADSLGAPLTALVFGKGINEAVTQAFQFGANRVIKCDDATLADFRLEPYAALLDKLVADEKPQIVLGGASTRGRELLAAAAADANAGLLPEVTELDLKDGALVATHPVYAGKVLSTAALSSGLQFATLRSRAFPTPTPDPGKSGE